MKSNLFLFLLLPILAGSDSEARCQEFRDYRPKEGEEIKVEIPASTLFQVIYLGSGRRRTSVILLERPELGSLTAFDGAWYEGPAVIRSVDPFGLRFPSRDGISVFEQKEGTIVVPDGKVLEIPPEGALWSYFKTEIRIKFEGEDSSIDRVSYYGNHVIGPAEVTVEQTSPYFLFRIIDNPKETVTLQIESSDNLSLWRREGSFSIDREASQKFFRLGIVTPVISEDRKSEQSDAPNR